jgi:murein DD-endopeptidase MepM/ murein hydrolase activator NlpD
MSRAEQMKYVDKYFEYWNLKKGAGAGQLYSSVFAPAYASSDPNKVLYSSPSAEYRGNAPLDINRDGKITVAEMGGRIEKKKKEFGISDNVSIIPTGRTAQELSRGITTTVVDEFKGKPGGSSGVITSERGNRIHPLSGGLKMHHGIDIAPAGRGYYVSFKKNGKVNYVGFRGAYGNMVDIITPDGTCYRFAHLAKTMVRNGDPYNGQTIGEIGDTGGTSGIHLHYEVRPKGPYGDSINPRPYLGLLSIGKKLTGSPGQQTQISTPTSSTLKLPPAQVSSPTSPTQLSPRLFQTQTPRTQQAQVSSTTTRGQNVPSIGNNRRGQQVIIADNPQQSQPQQVSSKSSGGEFEIILADDSLNSMIRNQILLELAYT